jgi:hypothetical protein
LADDDGGGPVVGVGELFGCEAAGESSGDADAGGAEFAEGGEVPAGLAGEVAAEAEHVRPLAHPSVGSFVLFGQPQSGDDAAEAPAGRDEPSDVGGVGVGVHVVACDAGGDEAGGFAAFGGVLGQLGGDVSIGEIAAVEAAADDFDDELLAPLDEFCLFVDVEQAGSVAVLKVIVTGAVAVS